MILGFKNQSKIFKPNTHTHTSKSEMRLRKEAKDKEDTKKFITVEGYDSRTSKKKLKIDGEVVEKRSNLETMTTV